MSVRSDARRRSCGFALLVALTGLFMVPAVVLAPLALAAVTTYPAIDNCLGGTVYAPHGIRYLHPGAGQIVCDYTVPANSTAVLRVYAGIHDATRLNVAGSVGLSNTANVYTVEPEAVTTGSQATSVPSLLWTSGTVQAGAGKLVINKPYYNDNVSLAISQWSMDVTGGAPPPPAEPPPPVSQFRWQTLPTDTSSGGASFWMDNAGPAGNGTYGYETVCANGAGGGNGGGIDSGPYPIAKSFNWNCPGSTLASATVTGAAGVTPLVWESGPDTTAPTAPTVSLDKDGENVAISWSGATDARGVTGYRYRCAVTDAWTIWASPVAAECVGATVEHQVAVQARDAAGNWSPSGLATWQQCSFTFTDSCDETVGWTTDEEGVEDPGILSSCRLSKHCLGWYGPRPPATPTRATWTFAVKDYGISPDVKDYIFGWTCGILGPLYGGESPVNVVVGMRGGRARQIPVVCPTGRYIYNFYALGRTADLSVPDYSNVLLWWGYGRPGTVPPSSEPSGTGECTNGCGTTPAGFAAAPAGSSPTPTRVAPAPAPAPVDDSPPPSGSCNFGITDPSSWMCSLAGVLGKLLSLVKGIYDFVMSLGKFMVGLFVPDGDVLSGHLDDLDASWDASPPGVMVGALGDVAAPLTDMDTTPPANCSGVAVTLPLGAWSMTMNPLSTCSELTQYILGVLIPLESALIYLGAFFLAFRIVTKPFGLEASPAVAST